MKKITLLAISLIFFGSCKFRRQEPKWTYSNRGISNSATTAVIFSDYVRFYQQQPYSHISVIKSFLNNCKCDSVQKKYYANTYLCTEFSCTQEFHSPDTFLLFSICEDLPDFLKPNYNGPTGYEIDTSRKLGCVPKYVFTNVDSNVLKRKYKYIIADIINMLED